MSDRDDPSGVQRDTPGLDPSRYSADASRVGSTRSIPEEALRDVASQEFVDRLWVRLDAEIEPTPRRRSRAPLLWSLAASVLTFGLGISVGQRLEPSHGREAPVAMGAEPSVNASPAARADLVLDNARNGSEDTTSDFSGREDLSDGVSHDANRSRMRGRSLLRGHSRLQAEDDSANAPPASTSSDEVGDLGAEVGEAALDGVAAPEAVSLVPALPSWQRLANAGEYEAALFELGQDGGFEAALMSSSAEQLMLLADVARATGQTQRALAALRRIVSEFRSEPVAPLAAYSLGNLLERSGDARGAAKAFAVYRALSPEGDFSEDALVRQLQSAVERGDRDHAEQLLAQYQAGFPDGRRGEEVERWMEALHETELVTIAADGGAVSPESTANEDSENGDRGKAAPEQSDSEQH